MLVSCSATTPFRFQYAFAATSATIVAGTLAERCQMTAYLCYSIMLSGFVYPVIVHAVWSSRGFLSALADEPLLGVGMIDFAGSGVVHMTGGITAVIAAKVLGARKGRFYDERGNKLAKPRKFPGHSIALQVLGTFILWFGWYGFNVGSVGNISSSNNAKIVSLAAVNTTLAAAAGGVVALLVNLAIVEHRTGEPYFGLTSAMNGCLSGLVCITAGCALIEPWAAVIVGSVAGLLYLWFSSVLERWCIDDAVDAIPVHMINGLWGLISTGLFATPEHMKNVYGKDDNVGWFYEWGRGSGNFNLMGCQLIGIIFISAWVALIMLPFFFGLNYLGWFRADALEEIVGLDVSYHGGPTTQSYGDIKPEYMVAYLNRKNDQHLKRRRTTKSQSVDGSDHSLQLDMPVPNSEVQCVTQQYIPRSRGVPHVQAGLDSVVYSSQVTVDQLGRPIVPYAISNVSHGDGIVPEHQQHDSRIVSSKEKHHGRQNGTSGRNNHGQIPRGPFYGARIQVTGHEGSHLEAFETKYSGHYSQYCQSVEQMSGANNDDTGDREEDGSGV